MSIRLNSLSIIRNLILITFLLTCESVAARYLSQDEALRRALNEMKSSRKSRAAGNSLSSDFILNRTFKSSSGIPAIYLFSDDNRCLLLSASDKARPVLGYFDVEATGDFNNLPPSLEWYIEESIQEIESANNINESTTYTGNEYRMEWNPIEPLCTSSWGQNQPFNNECPVIDGNHCVTGCVPTAMAQVMKYHKWPDCGEGEITYTTFTENLNLTMKFDMPFDWDNMIDKYNQGNTSEEEKNAVAMLMKACGYSAQADYNIRETGSNATKAKDALINYFKYDCQLISRIYFSSQEWETLIYESIKTCGPVLYTGSGNRGGHAFVCDGYSSDGYFHINWGWDGGFNGYFLLSALDTNSGNFSNDQSAIIGITPKGKGCNPFPDYSIMLTSLYAKLGEYLEMTFWISDEFESIPESGFCFEDCTGTKRFLQAQEQTPTTKLCIEMKLPIQNIAMPDGTYKLTPAIIDSNGNWKELQISNRVAVTYHLVIENGRPVRLNEESIRLKASELELLTEIYDGSDFKVGATITNPTDRYISREIGISMWEKESGTRISNTKSENIYVDLSPGESKHYEFSAYFYCTPPLTAPTDYTLKLWDITASALDCEEKDVTVKLPPLPEVTNLEIPETFYYAPDTIRLSLKGPYEGHAFWIIRDKASGKQVGTLYEPGNYGDRWTIKNGETKDFEIIGYPDLFKQNYGDLTIALHDGEKAKDLTPLIPIKIEEPTVELIDFKTTTVYPNSNILVRGTIRNTSHVRLNDLNLNSHFDLKDGSWKSLKLIKSSLENPFSLAPDETVDFEMKTDSYSGVNLEPGEYELRIDLKNLGISKKLGIVTQIQVLELPDDYEPEIEIEDFVSDYKNDNLNCSFILRFKEWDNRKNRINYELSIPTHYLSSSYIDWESPLFVNDTVPVSLNDVISSNLSGEKCKLTLHWVHPNGIVKKDFIHEFTLTSQSGIEAPGKESTGISLEISGQTLIVKNVPSEENLRIYGTDGMLLEQRMSSGGTEYFTFSKKGIYILVAGSKTYKLII